jgi:hypothetical protein
MKENRAYKKDGQLVVQFTFVKGSSLFEMEEQIESLLASIEGPVSEAEKQSIKAQLLEAIGNAPRSGGSL